MLTSLNKEPAWRHTGEQLTTGYAAPHSKKLSGAANSAASKRAVK